MVFSVICLFRSRIFQEDHDAAARTALLSFVRAAGAIGFAPLGCVEPAQARVWAADHVFVFGDPAMAVVSSYLLKTATSASPGTAADAA